NRIDVFVQGTDNALYTKSWNGASWSDYTQLGPNPIVGQPSVVSWGPNRIDVFVQGTDNALYTKSWNGASWSDYTQIGPNPIVGQPSVVSWGPNRIDVFVQGSVHDLLPISWNGASWSDYTQLGPNPIVGQPSVVSWGPNRIDFFVQGTDNALYIKSFLILVPQFSPGGSGYIPVQCPQTVTIWDDTPGAAIYYTTDGSNPTTSSVPYTVPL